MSESRACTRSSADEWCRLNQYICFAKRVNAALKPVLGEKRRQGFLADQSGNIANVGMCVIL